MGAIPMRNDLAARLARLERAVADLARPSRSGSGQGGPLDVAVAMGGGNYTLTATPTPLNGMFVDTTVAGPDSIYHVDLTYDLAASVGGNRAAVGQLVVGFQAQPAQILAVLPVTDMRGTYSQHYRVTGLGQGDYRFQANAFYVDPGSPTGTLVVRPTHTTMIITQTA